MHFSVALTWPAEAVPDGTILAVHHYWVGLLLALYAVWHVSDDHPHREPSIVLGGILTATVGFLTWQHYPVAGAVLSHVGLGAILGATLIGSFMSRYRWVGFRGLVLVGLLVSLDDLLSHAWDVWTPLDGWLWMEVLLPWLYAVRSLLA